MKDQKAVDDEVTEDELEVEFYNGDSGNINKMLKGKKATTYGFNKSTLRLDHIAMKYEVVKPEFDGTVSFNVYLENDKETTKTSKKVKLMRTLCLRQTKS